MISSKKLEFWRLLFVFAGITVISLFLMWNSPQMPRAKTMDSNMGNMMKQMHLSKLNIYDLTGQQQGNDQMDEMHSHHQNQSSSIIRTNFLTTSTIFILLPFIIGGAVILAVVWIK